MLRSTDTNIDTDFEIEIEDSRVRSTSMSYSHTQIEAPWGASKGGDDSVYVCTPSASISEAAQSETVAAAVFANRPLGHLGVNR